MFEFIGLVGWFATGGQHLYGEETLAEIASHSDQISAPATIADFKKELKWNGAYFRLVGQV